MSADNTVPTGPKHVAIIMDGNGRWATQRSRPRLFGHQAGAKRVRQAVETCPKLGVKYLTMFAFSTENWKRTQSEVSGLMALFRRYIQREANYLHRLGTRVRFIGEREKLDKKLQALMDYLEKLTENNDTTHLTIALNYGARDEVTRATQRLAVEIAEKRLRPDQVNSEVLASFLDTCMLPDPDLVIRTSGEARISNFLLWQSAYAEYEFIDTHWPDYLAVRMSSGAVMAVLGIAAVWAGGIWFMAMLTVICAALVWELVRMLGGGQKRALTMAALAAGSFLAVRLLPPGVGLPFILLPAIAGIAAGLRRLS